MKSTTRRLTALTSNMTDGEVQRVLGKLEATGQDYLVVKMLANASAAFRPFVLLGDALLNRASLPAPIREAAILRAGALTNSWYEWEAHAKIARSLGLSDEQVDAATQGSGSALAPEQELAVRICESLINRSQVTGADWNAAISLFGPEGATQLIMSIAWWGGFMPLIVKALELNPSAAEGEDAPNDQLDSS